MDFPWTEFAAFFGPILQDAHAIGLTADMRGRPHAWRGAVPPFAVETKSGVRRLTADNFRWCMERGVFPRLIQNDEFERKDGSRFKQDSLILYQLLSLPIVGELYHATPADLVDRIQQSGGLRPGRLTGTFTTGFNGSEHWIHVSASLTDQRNWIQKDKLLAHRSQKTEWVIFSIAQSGISGQMFPDPASQTGFVLPDEFVPWDALREVERVSVVPN